MVKLITLLEQHLDRQPPTVVTQATTWWETVFACVKLMESGLGVHLPVNVCFCVCKHEYWGEQTLASYLSCCNHCQLSVCVCAVCAFMRLHACVCELVCVCVHV